MPLNHSWTVAEAKAKFSEVLAKASDEPQVITRNGRRTAVVVSVAAWEQRSARVGTLADFLAGSPLVGSGLDIERGLDAPRDIDL